MLGHQTSNDWMAASHDSGHVIRHQRLRHHKQDKASKPTCHAGNLKLDDEYDEAVDAEFKAWLDVCMRGHHHNRKPAATDLLVGRNVTLICLQRLRY